MNDTILKRFIKSIICEAISGDIDPVRPEDLRDDPTDAPHPALALTKMGPAQDQQKQTAEVSAKTLSTQYVQVKSLPSSLKNALYSIGYNKADIAVEATEGYYAAGSADDGTRNMVTAVNLATGEFQKKLGSWGGANPFEKKQIDLDDKVRPIPYNFAIIKGTDRGGKILFARILVNPSNLQALLPETTENEISEKEKVALNIIGGIKSGYRKQYFGEYKLGAYAATNPLIQSMAEKGWIKITGTGIQMTTSGRNMREQNRIHNI